MRILDTSEGCPGGPCGRETLGEWLSRLGATTVRLEWSDLHGLSRGKRLSVDHFLRLREEGFAFSSAALSMNPRGNVVAQTKGPQDQGWPNILARPLADSLRPLPTEPNTVQVLADLYHADGRPVEESPRHVLRRVLSAARSRGFEVCIGLELEFYLFRDRECVPPPAGKQVYHLRQTPAEAGVLRAILGTMEALGIPAEAGFPEDAPGQLEVVLPPAPALQVADAAFLVRNLAKEIASQQGLFCTFLSKPLAEESGSGLHIHQSLTSLSSGLSAFYDGTQEGGLSHLLRHYLAGQLAYLPQAFALYLPTINAYKRALNREHGGLAATWGFDNRTAALRVLGRSPGSLRLENRVAGGEANPYLAIAACVATGLAGIDADLEPPTPSTGNAYAPVSDHQLLPTNLRHALDLLDGSRILKEALGEAAVDRFLALKWDEVRRFECSITDWERREYLDLF